MAQANQRQISEQLSSSHGSFELVVSPLLLGLGGLWIDSKLGTTPWVTIGATVFGILGVVTVLYLRYTAEMARHAENLSAIQADRTAGLRAERDAAVAERAQLESKLEAELAEFRSTGSEMMNSGSGDSQ